MIDVTSPMRYLPLLLLPALVSACCLGGDCNEPGLTLTAQQTTTVAKPANVTVAFKVEDDAGRGVTGLSIASKNFEIYEDGVLISAFEAAPTVLPRPGRFSSYTVMLLDLSGSILASQSLSTVKAAAQQFVTTVVPEPASADVLVGIWWFDGAAQLHALVPFTSSRSDLVAGIQSLNGTLSTDNSTNLYGAFIAGIDSASTRSAADRARNITSIGSVVLFTDGTDQAARVTLQAAEQRLDKTNPDEVKSYAIGLGGEVNGGVLGRFGRDGYFPTKDLAGLSGKFGEAAQRVKDIANSFYVLQYCSPKRAGTHTLRVEAIRGDQRGSLETLFSAEGFTGGCTTSPAAAIREQ